VWSFASEGLNLGGTNASHLRYANLPREIVCTENLTPWKKLLPCESHSGLAELLNAKNMYSANYHSLALDLRPICKDKKCQESSLELKLSVSLVNEPTVYQGNTFDGIKADWSFKTAYGSNLFTSCPRSTLSKIYIDVTTNKSDTQWHFKPPSDGVFIHQRGGISVNMAVYDLKKVTSWPLVIRSIYKNRSTYGIVPQPLIHATRFIGG